MKQKNVTKRTNTLKRTVQYFSNQNMRQSNVEELLKSITKTVVGLEKCYAQQPNDITDDVIVKLKDARKALDEAVDSVLRAQKARGKKFLTDQEVDEIVSKIINE